MARPTPDLLAPRIAPASRLTSFGGYQPAVCGHPAGMILTRARTLLRPCFARLLAALVGGPDGFDAGAFHARPLRRQSKSRRARKRALVRQSALRPLRFAPTIGSPSRGALRLLRSSLRSPNLIASRQAHLASGWFVHRTNHRQAYPPAEGCPLCGCSGRGAVTVAAIASRHKTHAAETPPPRTRFISFR